MHDAPAVISLHSSASSPRQWSALAQTLGSAYRVSAPALIGYGDTPDWHYQRPLSLDDEAERIEPLIDAEPEGGLDVLPIIRAQAPAHKVYSVKLLIHGIYFVAEKSACSSISVVFLSWYDILLSVYKS